MTDLATLDRLKPCPCGGQAHLGMIGACFIYLICPKCERATDPVTIVYQSDADAYDEAAELWNSD